MREFHLPTLKTTPFIFSKTTRTPNTHMPYIFQAKLSLQDFLKYFTFKNNAFKLIQSIILLQDVEDELEKQEITKTTHGDKTNHCGILETEIKIKRKYGLEKRRNQLY